MKKSALKYLIFILGAGLLTFLDRLSKLWAVQTLKGQEDIVWIDGVFRLHYLENQGMAFGLLQGKQVFFYVMTALIVLFVIVFLVRTPLRKRFLPVYIVEIFVMAGAMGNLIDRCLHRYVVDFLYFSLIDFPIFNVADCYVTCSCIVLLILLLFVYKEEELSEVFSFRKKKAEQ